jgi:hypothetical protein
MENGQAHALMIQLRMDLILLISGAWLQLVDELMANFITTNRRVIYQHVQTQLLDKWRAWVCLSAL